MATVQNGPGAAPPSYGLPPGLTQQQVQEVYNVSPQLSSPLFLSHVLLCTAFVNLADPTFSLPTEIPTDARAGCAL